MKGETCPRCDAVLPPEARFCAACGSAVERVPTRASPREERKVITALFADLAGSTQLGERLDPEDFRDLTSGALAQMGAAIEEYGGMVRGTAGDGVLALFGAPIAHEDDAERAVLAGLRLVERMRAYGAEAAGRWAVDPLRVRVGIETGLAVLGEVRAGSQVQYDASGDCLNTAARLEGAADTGGVLVGPLTYRLVSRAFDWGPARPLDLKGKAKQVSGRHALAARGDHAAHQRDTGTDSPLVGRDREVAIADEVVNEVASGACRAIFLHGEAGIGKTRFVREIRALFDAAVGESTTTWLAGTCLSYGTAEPYLPFRQVLRQVFGPSMSATQVRETVTPLVGATRADEIAPVLTMMLGLALTPEDAERTASAAPESRQHAMVRGFAEVLVGLARQSPVALIIDDLHWADPASLRLVAGLISELPGDVPVLLVLAMRPETDGGAWELRSRTLDQYPHCSAELVLTSLDRAAERRLITDLVGEGTIPSDLESLLVRRAEGNPFYLRELLKSLRDSGALAQSVGRWTFDTAIPVELPETVERVVLARIDRLPPGDRELLNTAAVIGREFDLSLLGRIAGMDLSPSSVTNLTQLGLFESAGTEFRFSHPLIQETAYRSMLRRGREELHGRAAAAIEDIAADEADQHFADLARHHAAAGHLAQAVKYHRLAAIAFMGVAAVDEAVHQLDSAVTAASRLDPDGARAALPELHLLRGRARGRNGDFLGGADDFRVSLARAREYGNSEIEVQALTDLGWMIRVHGYEEALQLHQEALRKSAELDDSSTQVTALSRMSLVYLNRLQLDRGLEVAQRALSIARTAGRDQMTGMALDCLKLAAHQLGDLDLLERTVAEIVEVQERTSDFYFVQWAYLEGASAPLARGDVDLAEEMIDRAFDLNRRFGADRVTRTMIFEARSWILRARGDLDGAISAVDEALQVMGDLRTPEWSAWLGASHGSHLLARGDTRAAIAELDDALGNSVAVQSPNRAFRAASHLSWACWLAGDPDAALVALGHAEEVLATITAPPGDVFLDGYHSYVALARTRAAFGDRDGAEAVLSPLLAAARRRGWLDAERQASDALSHLSGTVTGDAGVPPGRGR